MTIAMNDKRLLSFNLLKGYKSISKEDAFATRPNFICKENTEPASSGRIGGAYHRVRVDFNQTGSKVLSRHHKN